MSAMTQKYQSDCPPHMVTNAFVKTWSLPSSSLDEVWHTLQTREFFVKGQIPPYKVEFDAPSQTGPFASGELNIHHGPLLSVHGVIGDVTDRKRDLFYFYGSYVLSFRLVRPTLLKMYRDEDTLTIELHTYIKPWFERIWTLGNRLFWSSFGSWIQVKGNK